MVCWFTSITFIKTLASLDSSKGNDLSSMSFYGKKKSFFDSPMRAPPFTVTCTLCPSPSHMHTLSIDWLYMWRKHRTCYEFMGWYLIGTNQQTCDTVDTIVNGYLEDHKHRRLQYQNGLDSNARTATSEGKRYSQIIYQNGLDRTVRTDTSEGNRYSPLQYQNGPDSTHRYIRRQAIQPATISEWSGQ